MLISRRTFMRAGTLAALFAGVPLATVNVLGQRIRRSPDDNPVDEAAQINNALSNYTKATFVSYINSVFLFRAVGVRRDIEVTLMQVSNLTAAPGGECFSDRKSTRLNSSHEWISYAVFCLKKKII